MRQFEQDWLELGSRVARSLHYQHPRNLRLVQAAQAEDGERDVVRATQRTAPRSRQAGDDDADREVARARLGEFVQHMVMPALALGWWLAARRPGTARAARLAAGLGVLVTGLAIDAGWARPVAVILLALAIIFGGTAARPV